VPQYTTPKRLFIASTLSRAIGDPTIVRPLVPEVDQSIKETLQTWHTPGPDIPEPTLDSIYIYTRSVMERTNRGVAQDPTEKVIPLVSRKACAERSTKMGGVTAELVDQVEKERKAEYRRQLFPGYHHLWTVTTAPRRWEDHPSGKVMEYHARTKEEGGGTPFTLSAVDHDLLRSGATEEELYHHSLDRTLDEDLPLTAVPVGIPEWGCKTRIASKHPAHEVHISRIIGQNLVQGLKRTPAARDTLNGRPLQLRNHVKSRLYSADLSKATDNIPHKAAEAVAWGIIHALCLPAKHALALLRMCQPHETRLGATEKGIHMGLGTSWTILSLLNMWAARHSPTNSYGICGDDLLGLWTPDQILDYEAQFRSIGVPVNKQKSFYGVRGVFCEQLYEVEITQPGYVARVVPTVKLGDASAKRGITSGEELARLRQITQDASSTKPVQRLAQHRIDSVPLRLRARGPAPIGGTGGRPSENLACKAIFALLTQRLSINEARMSGTAKELYRQLSHCGRDPNGVDLQDLHAGLLRALEVTEITRKGRRMEFAKTRAELNRRQRLIRKIKRQPLPSNQSIIEATQGTYAQENFSARVLRFVAHKAGAPRTPGPQKWADVLRILLNNAKPHRIAEWEVRAIFQELPLPKKQNGKSLNIEDVLGLQEVGVSRA